MLASAGRTSLLAAQWNQHSSVVPIVPPFKCKWKLGHPHLWQLEIRSALVKFRGRKELKQNLTQMWPLGYQGLKNFMCLKSSQGPPKQWALIILHYCLKPTKLDACWARRNATVQERWIIWRVAFSLYKCLVLDDDRKQVHYKESNLWAHLSYSSDFIMCPNKPAGTGNACPRHCQ